MSAGPVAADPLHGDLLAGAAVARLEHLAVGAFSKHLKLLVVGDASKRVSGLLAAMDARFLSLRRALADGRRHDPGLERAPTADQSKRGGDSCASGAEEIEVDERKDRG